MKGTSAPQTGDIRTGIGVGEAQVWNFDDLNRRVNKLTDDKIARKNKEKDDDIAREDAMLASLGTEGVLVRDQLDLQNQVSEFVNSYDVERAKTDKAYKMQKMNEMNHIKASIKYSADSRSALNEQWKLYNADPLNHEEPVLEDTHSYEIRDPRRYNAKTTMGEIWTPEETMIDKKLQFNQQLMKTSGGAKDDRAQGGSKTTWKKTSVLDKDVDKFIETAKSDANERKFYNFHWNKQYPNASKMTPEELEQNNIPTLDSYMEQQIRNFALEARTTTDELGDLSKDGRGKLNDEKAINRFKNVTRAEGGFSQEIQELNNVEDEKGRFFQDIEDRTVDGKKQFRFKYDIPIQTSDKEQSGSRKTGTSSISKKKDYNTGYSDWLTEDQALIEMNNLYNIKEDTDYSWQDVKDKSKNVEFEELWAGGEQKYSEKTNVFTSTKKVDGKNVEYIDVNKFTQGLDNTHGDDEPAKRKAFKTDFTPAEGSGVVLTDVETQFSGDKIDIVTYEVDGKEVEFNLVDGKVNTYKKGEGFGDEKGSMKAFQQFIDAHPEAYPVADFSTREQKTRNVPTRKKGIDARNMSKADLADGDYLDENGVPFSIFGGYITVKNN